MICKIPGQRQKRSFPSLGRAAEGSEKRPPCTETNAIRSQRGPNQLAHTRGCATLARARPPARSLRAGLRPAAAPSRDALNTMSLIQCDGGFFEAESCSLAGLDSFRAVYDGSATYELPVLSESAGGQAASRHSIRRPLSIRTLPASAHRPIRLGTPAITALTSSDKVRTHARPLRTCSRVKLRCSSVEISTRLHHARCMLGVCQVYVACCIRRAVVQQVAPAAYRSCNLCRAWTTPASRLARARSRRGGPTAASSSRRHSAGY
jgi:hypothetical protein